MWSALVSVAGRAGFRGVGGNDDAGEFDAFDGVTLALSGDTGAGTVFDAESAVDCARTRLPLEEPTKATHGKVLEKLRV